MDKNEASGDAISTDHPHTTTPGLKVASLIGETTRSMRDAIVPFGRLDLASDVAFLKAISMVAACWGCGYGADREFTTKWRKSAEFSAYRLVDAAEDGPYSLQVEGLYTRYLIGLFGVTPPVVHASFFGDRLSDLPDDVSVVFTRSDWDTSLASEADWEALRTALKELAFCHHHAFYSGDMAFVDMAIDWLKAGNACVAACCSQLPDQH